MPPKHGRENGITKSSLSSSRLPRPEQLTERLRRIQQAVRLKLATMAKNGRAIAPLRLITKEAVLSSSWWLAGQVERLQGRDSPHRSFDQLPCLIGTFHAEYPVLLTRKAVVVHEEFFELSHELLA